MELLHLLKKRIIIWQVQFNQNGTPQQLKISRFGKLDRFGNLVKHRSFKDNTTMGGLPKKSCIFYLFDSIPALLLTFNQITCTQCFVPTSNPGQGTCTHIHITLLYMSLIHTSVQICKIGFNLTLDTYRDIQRGDIKFLKICMYALVCIQRH